jgi:hypothetical protein
MIASQEIRWFTQQAQPALLDWFAQQGQQFDRTPARTDYYLVGAGGADLAPKLREGKVEIKHRRGTPEPYALTGSARGYLEQWVKWSFQLDPADPLATQITGARADEDFWVAVYKQRMGVKLGPDQDGTQSLHPLSAQLDRGCQIEYTRVVLQGQTWYTFNLEWFGEPLLRLDPARLDAILGDSHLPEETSMGYGAFLLQQSGLSP